jgi:hypothetical protein
MKNTLLIGLALSGMIAQADTLALWDFDSDTLNPTLGAGTLAPIGGVSSFFGFGNGSSDPTPSPDNRAWGISNLPPQGTDSGTAGMEGAVSTVGFANITLSFDTKTQFSSSKYYEVRYRTSNVGSWSTAATYGVATEDVWENQKTFNLSALDAGVNNNAEFQFQVVAIFKPGFDQYFGMSDTSGSYGRFGTVNDMVTVTGTAIPEPEQWALILGCAGLVLLWRRHTRG